MRKISRPFLLFLFLGLGSASLAVGAEQVTPIDITGDSVEYFYEEDRAVGKGNVRIDYEGWVLTADEVEINLKTKEAEATGNVVLVQEGAIYKGESVFVDFENKSAEVSKVRATIAPYYFAKGKTVRKVRDEYYHITDGYLTTCEDPGCDEEAIPFYRIESKEVLYYPEDKIIVKHAVMRLGNIPFFYIPVMVIPLVDFDRFPVEVQVGRRREWGAFALSRLRYAFGPSHKGNLLFDIREKQGLAGGIEHFYQTPGFGEGAVRYYYADDQCGEESLDCSRSRSHVADESSRYRVQARHRWHLFEDTALNTEMNKLSDEFVIQDFFYRREYERIVFPDNYVSLIHSKEDYTLSALARYRLDDFVGVVERTPQIRFDTHTHGFEDTPFYYRQEIQGSRLNLREKDSEDRHKEANRIDVRHTLSYVWRLQPWTITPFVASRETYYSRDHAGDDRDFVRWNLESGVDASTKFFKTYDTTIQALGLDINQIRHIVTPSIQYRYQSKPAHVRESLYQFDQIDDLDHENFFRFELENKLQTKSHVSGGELAPRTLVRTIAYADLLTPAMNRSRLDQIGMEIELDPYPWLMMAGDTQYRFEADQFEYANVDVVLKHEPFWIGFGQRYVNGDSNQTTAQIDWRISPEWSVRFYERFEFARGETDEFEVTVEKRNFFCWTVRLTFNYRNGPSFFFSFAPTAFPESAFQPTQTYRRKDPNLPVSGLLSSRDY